MRSMPGDPFEGRTGDSQIEQIESLSGVTAKIALVDRGYRGVEPAAPTRVLVSHARRLPKKLKRLLKHRRVAEPIIGHMKADGLLDGNWLEGALLGMPCTRFLPDGVRRHSTLGYSSPVRFLEDWSSKHVNQQSKAA